MTRRSCSCSEHIINLVTGVSRPSVLDCGMIFGGRDSPLTPLDNLWNPIYLATEALSDSIECLSIYMSIYKCQGCNQKFILGYFLPSLSSLSFLSFSLPFSFPFCFSVASKWTLKSSKGFRGALLALTVGGRTTFAATRHVPWALIQ